MSNVPAGNIFSFQFRVHCSSREYFLTSVQVAMFQQGIFSHGVQVAVFWQEYFPVSMTIQVAMLFSHGISGAVF